MSARISLYDIIATKKEEVEDLKDRFPLSKIRKAVERSQSLEVKRDFKRAISHPHKINIIGEVKKASPSEGIIRSDFNPQKIAEIYEYAPIRALSILTEMHYFKGRTSYLKTIRQITTKPILRKDFIVDRYQIYESALYSADAALLIASVLTGEELRSFIDEMMGFGIYPLVEVHNQEDLDKALTAGAEIIGINNRNLATFEVDLAVTEMLARQIPKGKVVVAESGIKTHADIQRLNSIGVNTFLIGTTFMRAPDILAKVQEIYGH